MNARRRVRRMVAGGALALVLAGCGGSGNGVETAPPPADQVKLATEAIERRDYAEAEALLKGYVQRNPTGDEAGEAHYLLGLVQFRRKEWPSAATEFSIVISQYASDDRVPDARYHLGLAYWRQARPSAYDQDMTQRAIAEFDRFLSLYPEHPRADEVRSVRREARDRLAKKAYDNGELYLKLGYYEPARFYFQLVQRDFPDSSWLAPAQLGEARTWFKQERWSECRAALERLLSGSPPEDVAREARELRQRLPAHSSADEGPARAGQG